MVINKIILTSVGADVSRPPPMYRPLVPFPLSGIICKNSLSAFGGCPDTQMKTLKSIIQVLLDDVRYYSLRVKVSQAHHGFTAIMNTNVLSAAQCYSIIASVLAAASRIDCYECSEQIPRIRFNQVSYRSIGRQHVADH